MSLSNYEFSKLGELSDRVYEYNTRQQTISAGIDTWKNPADLPLADLLRKNQSVASRNALSNSSGIFHSTSYHSSKAIEDKFYDANDILPYRVILTRVVKVKDRSTAEDAHIKQGDLLFYEIAMCMNASNVKEGAYAENGPELTLYFSAYGKVRLRARISQMVVRKWRLSFMNTGNVESNDGPSGLTETIVLAANSLNLTHM